MGAWPEDVLLIHYADLGSSPDERLHLLGAISALFDKPASFYTSAMLGLHSKQWNALSIWLSQENGARFWHLEAQGIQIIRICEQHLLIGTSQVLADLRNTTTNRLSSRQLLEDMWAAALHYVESEIVKRNEVANG